MNGQFSLPRFYRLFIKHSAEHVKSYLMSLAVLMGVLVLGGGFLLFVIEARLDIEVLNVLFMIIQILAGTIFASTIFSELGEKRKAIPWLTLPASHFEKFLVAWIYSYLIFIIVYSGLFYFLANIALGMQGVTHGDHFSLFGREFLISLVIFSFLHALAFFGAIRFRNLHFIRTAFFFIGAFFLVIILNHSFLESMVHRSVDLSPPFTVIRFNEAGRTVLIEPETAAQPMIFIMIVAVFIWVATFFCIGEKQT